MVHVGCLFVLIIQQVLGEYDFYVPCDLQQGSLIGALQRPAKNVTWTAHIVPDHQTFALNENYTLYSKTSLVNLSDSNLRLHVSWSSKPAPHFRTVQAVNIRVLPCNLSSLFGYDSQSFIIESRLGLLSNDVFSRMKRVSSYPPTTYLRLLESQALGWLNATLSQHVTNHRRVKNAPIETDYLRIYANGSIQLYKPLDFEAVQDNELTVNITLEDTVTRDERLHRVVLTVIDVDEPPYFLNTPRPFLAAVSESAKTGTSVYTFSARDPEGAALTYVLVNDDADVRFEVDRSSGVVRLTKSIEDKAANHEFEVYVQACEMDTKPDVKLRHATQKTELTSCSEMARLQIRVGQRPPQFLESRYEVSVPEDLRLNIPIVRVQAKAFGRFPVPEPVYYNIYELDSRRPSQLFSIDQRGGIVKLASALQKGATSLKATVTARQRGMESVAKLVVTVTDVNDHNPVFGQPIYSVRVREDIQPWATIITVLATDLDEGQNAELDYALSGPDAGLFYIHGDGRVVATGRLDADVSSVYNLTVIATDRGETKRSDHALLYIRTKNVNDEAPIFTEPSQYTAFVAEDAIGGSPVMTISARDPDRDQVYYSFRDPWGGPGVQEVELFTIDRDTGAIFLRDDITSYDLAKADMYNMTVVAEDDGSCCDLHPGETKSTHYSEASIVIGVRDVNNNRPTFPDCEKYSSMASVPEGKHRNYTIITVRAIDNDSGLNGRIIYSLYFPEKQTRKFMIDPITGELKASPYVDFDREERTSEPVTVKATDKGDRPLIGFCNIVVRITDENDNAPDFDQSEYRTTIPRSTSRHTTVLRIFADDRDAGGPNSEVHYSLVEDAAAGRMHGNDRSYFQILSTGDLKLLRALPPSISEFYFVVTASDRGSPRRTSTANVRISVSVKDAPAPVWEESNDCGSDRRIAENVVQHTLVFRCCAKPGGRSGKHDEGITYHLVNGAKKENNKDSEFRVFMEKHEGMDCAVIRTDNHLDYDDEELPSKTYRLTLYAKHLITQAESERKHLRVLLEDVNDRVPEFVQEKYIVSIPENQELYNGRSKDKIATIQAVDSDSVAEFRKVRYEILTQTQLFEIDSDTGDLYAKSVFDRERIDTYIIEVQAQDSAPSALGSSKRPNRDIVKVQINIDDVNDNPPYWNQSTYRAQVREDADKGKTVITLAAFDNDTQSIIKYDLDSRGNIGNVFSIDAQTGQLYVNRVKPDRLQAVDGRENHYLDYERQQAYDLTVYANDGKHRTSVTVHIEVKNVNDEAPIFVQPQYKWRFIEEDGEGWSFPHKLATVEARDLDSPSGELRYKLVGQGAGTFFTINHRNGDIYVAQMVDRDPPTGNEKWHLIVQAIDDNGNGLVGTAEAEITLKDINDNAPNFKDDIIGYVEEERQPPPGGIYVMQMQAIDNDDIRTDNAKITYSLQRNKEFNGQPVFRIDPNNGKIFLLAKLDREDSSQRQFELEVLGVDHGQIPLSGTGKCIVKVTDKNDNPPHFEMSEYSAKVKEDARRGDPIVRIAARDPDDSAMDNILTYEMVVSNSDPKAAELFYVTTDVDSGGQRVGVLRVNARQLDYEDASQRVPLRVHLRVSDGNPSPQHSASTDVVVRIADVDDTPPRFVGLPSLLDARGRSVNGIRIQETAVIASHVFTFHVEDTDSKEAEFFLAPQDGLRYFNIGPKDGKLTVARPLDREEKEFYHLNIGARDENGNEGFAAMSVYLADVNDNAPSLVPNQPCVVMENSPPGAVVCTVHGYDPDTAQNGPPFFMQVDGATQDFDITFDQYLDSGNGGLRVTSRRSFDREQQKKYSVNVMVSDSGQPQMKGLRMLDIVVGDENDNPMSDGRKVIWIYSYKGQLSRSHIGNVYVNDLDDWDAKDKTFQWSGGKPLYFDLLNNGSLFIEDSAPESSKDGYVMRVSVFDKVRNEQAVGTVVIHVLHVSEEAFEDSTSIRIRGITADDLISAQKDGSNRLEQLRTAIGEVASADATDVKIFSIMPQTGASTDSIDIRFSVGRKTFYDRVYLTGILQRHRKRLEVALSGARLEQIGVNECNSELCWTGCQNVQSALPTGELVNANRTAFVGVWTQTEAKCIETPASCPQIRTPKSCAIDTCYNGGVCHDTGSDFFCECDRTESWHLRGPRCEGTLRSFRRRGFAWFSPIAPCNTMHVSFQFVARSDGVLIYNGPVGGIAYANLTEDERDHFYVAVYKGQLQVQGDLGATGGRASRVTIGKNLADGVWHSVDIIRRENAAELEVVLDKCRTAKVDPTTNVPDYTGCYAKVVLPNGKTLLNVNSPLQLGGIYSFGESSQFPPVPTFDSIDGCIRQLSVNGELYDLNRPVFEKYSSVGCTHSSCGDSSNPVCDHGECLGYAGWLKSDSYKCICDPGWGGPNCDEVLPWYRFNRGSYVQYLIANSRNGLLNPFYTDLHVLFVSDKPDGTIVHAANSEGNEYLTTRLDSWSPVLQHNHGGIPPPLLQLPSTARVFSNQSYVLQSRSWPGYASISLDRFDTEPNTIVQHRAIATPSKIDFDPSAMIVGASDVNPNGDRNDFEGCIADLRWNEISLPISKSDTSASSNAKISNTRGVAARCTQRTTCLTQPRLCTPPLVCMDFWKGPFCSCPPGQKPSVDRHGRATGCAEYLATQVQVGITMNAVAAILVSLLALVLLILLLACFVKRRRQPLFRDYPQDEEIRENIMNYAEEGGGEEDQDAYDISRLRKPVLPMENGTPLHGDYNGRGNGLNGNIAELIDDRIADANHDPTAAPFDELRVWVDEGGAGLSRASSLSSIGSAAGSEGDVERLAQDMAQWGPKFRRLSELYA